MLDSGAEGPGFKSQLRRCRVTVLGKLFTPRTGICSGTRRSVIEYGLPFFTFVSLEKMSSIEDRVPPLLKCFIAFSVLTLLVGRQEAHLACKNCKN